jgi:hypothetical protein
MTTTSCSISRLWKRKKKQGIKRSKIFKIKQFEKWKQNWNMTLFTLDYQVQQLRRKEWDFSGMVVLVYSSYSLSQSQETFGSLTRTLEPDKY